MEFFREMEWTSFRLVCSVLCNLFFEVSKFRFIFTGYIVFSSVKNVSGVLGLQVLVQSHKSPEHVDQRIENFIHEMQVGDAFSWTKPSVFFFRPLVC